ncbi:MAG: hypothetical protein A2729_02405 [Candidatus Buchananbacteria bacterium RIFCSPHIGHO2_01_FULL_39_14]|uniref:GxxExxY protein n=2 Tax=Candidatus Buchananiibacteriota TaxID=1817903 RepID=A0A1G1YNI1_9BACT|nr:MAG: hypothetical protein A2729_02405 [Candidatus Buchananbacteria bacterium RIFCSPHIGHO2_01_FULL_39_14]OGY48587.1 MAG: hypothetical protein A3D39_01915 [Candidatus Buchananbacteria bacterium RIFCSPHIGHO2_02_FULL_39_17]OGY53905.1 MAG: hypothetical protein A2912_04950 [Candidatus Buchananbacteria bacterium RIFCSPLOWO2_01_FULL_40_23b]
MLTKIIYPALSYKIIGLCFQTHNELEHFCKEKQYADRLEQLLRLNKINYKREIKIPFQFNSNKIESNIADFLVEDKIILECKAKKFIIREDYHQVQRYRRAIKIKLGIIVNFGTKYLTPKRIINYDL